MRPQFPNRSSLNAKRVLLIDRCQATRAARAAVLRSRGVQVQEAAEITDAHYLWRPNAYALVMLDVRRYSSEEIQKFCAEITGTSPRQQFVFRMGSPADVSRTWPGEVAAHDPSRGQWAETVKRFVAAA